MGKISITKENLEPDVRVVAGDALSHDEQIKCAALSLACRYYVEATSIAKWFATTEC